MKAPATVAKERVASFNGLVSTLLAKSEPIPSDPDLLIDLLGDLLAVASEQLALLDDLAHHHGAKAARAVHEASLRQARTIQAGYASWKFDATLFSEAAQHSADLAARLACLPECPLGDPRPDIIALYRQQPRLALGLASMARVDERFCNAAAWIARVGRHDAATAAVVFSQIDDTDSAGSLDERFLDIPPAVDGLERLWEVSPSRASELARTIAEYSTMSDEPVIEIQLDKITRALAQYGLGNTRPLNKLLGI